MDQQIPAMSTHVHIDVWKEVALSSSCYLSSHLHGQSLRSLQWQSRAANLECAEGPKARK